MEIISPHNIKSRDVEEDDIKRVRKDAFEMYQLCYESHGIYSGGKAIAHQQITDHDPLRFFVTRNNEIFINPIIIKHTKTTITSKEGCLSFPNKKMVVVPRWNKCRIEGRILLLGGTYFAGKDKMNISGELSKIFQHEIDHFDCKYIYGEPNGQRSAKK